MLSFFYTVVIYPITQIIEIVFLLLDKLFRNEGVAIIGVSLTVTLLCLPLYIVAENWQDEERRIQAKMAGRLARIRQAFKGDERYMMQSVFYRQNNYHPVMALRSAFGILIQVPFFMAAYTCLSNMEALNGARFLFINDMGKPDALFSVGGFGVNVLPIAMTIINCVAGAVYSKGHAVREKIQIYGMAALFLIILYNSPAGLVLYWTMNNILSLVKNIFYKLKNPLRVLYICMCALIVFVVVFALFIYDGGVDIKKRAGASIPLVLLLPLPLYIKFTGWLLDNPLKVLTENKRLRFLIFALASIALCVFMGLALPSSMFASSVQEFSNIDNFGSPNQLLRFPFLQAVGIVFWSWCVYFLFNTNERIQSVLATVFACALFCGIMDAYVFAGDYGPMDAALKFLGAFKSQGVVFYIVNAFAVLALCAATVFAIARAREKIVWALGVCVFAFAAIGVANMASISKEYKDFQRIIAFGKDEDCGQNAGSTPIAGGGVEGGGERGADNNVFSPQFHFSKNGKNVVVLMLDRCEASFFDSILDDQPALRNSFRGFTFHRNTISFNLYTLMGGPPIYGGYEYTPMEMNRRADVPLKQKHNEALLLMPRILAEQADFTAKLYDLSWANYSYIADMSFVKDFGNDKIVGTTLLGRYTGTYKQEHGDISKIPLSKGLERNTIWVSLFRTIPVIFRSAIYYKGTWLNSVAVDGDENFLDWYSALHYMPQITSFDAEQNSFMLLTNEATHSANDTSALKLFDNKSVSHKSTSYENCTAVLLALGKWLDYLKGNGVYDNTRIIIVSDHGIGYELIDENLFGNEPNIGRYHKDHLYPILIAKDFGSNEPLCDDMTFMTNADVPSLALADIVINPKNPWTGNFINNNQKDKGVLVTTCDIHKPAFNKSKFVFQTPKDSWYRVKENIFEPQNWTQEIQNTEKDRLN